MSEFAAIKERMERQNLNTALNHLNQAESALNRREWESANAQMRSGVEALFDSIVQLRLTSNKIRGEARKELEAQGILREPEARLVKGFFAVAAGAGSHAGVSNEDEARGRFLAGLGICCLGLALIPELVRVEDALADELEHPSDTEAYEEGYDPSQVTIRWATDAEICTSCPTCGDKQKLIECAMKRDDSDTVYLCRNGCQRIVEVGYPGDSLRLSKEIGWGRYVIRNAAEMRIPVYGKDTGELLGNVTLWALREALMKRTSPTDGT